MSKSGGGVYTLSSQNKQYKDFERLLKEKVERKSDIEYWENTHIR